MIKLYGIPRSRTMRPLWMLEELGVPYETVKVSFVGDARKPDYLRLNPNGHIPTLQDGDLVLWESLAINLYLARKHDKGLWPKTVEGEGKAFQWSIWAMTELEEPVLTVLLNRVFFPPEQRDAKKADDAAVRVKQPLSVLESALSGKEYLAGTAFGVADLNVAAVLSWAPLGGIDLAPTPNTKAWLERCTGRPAFQKVLTMT
ncbi:MAG TPA: glutathione S-transferase family protein [Candidatus Binatia bacterium]|nr:glutathione S-transferase family protein [Candidatus Binatia bacterium]